MAQSYIEQFPVPQLSGVVRTVWVQSTGDAPYVQRHLPTGGVEIHVRLGEAPMLLGPLTHPHVEVVPPRTTIIGLRFFPATAPPLPVMLDDLVDQRISLEDLWHDEAPRITDTVAGTSHAADALPLLQRNVLEAYRRTAHLDRTVAAAARILMPWTDAGVGAAAARLGLSESQLRRRTLQATGLSPKTLQRTLRFQGFLALAQAAAASRRHPSGGLSLLAAEAGYADQAHLTRECVRIAGVTPVELLRGGLDRCACGHDHVASYRPFLAPRGPRS